MDIVLQNSLDIWIFTFNQLCRAFITKEMCCIIQVHGIFLGSIETCQPTVPYSSNHNQQLSHPIISNIAWMNVQVTGVEVADYGPMGLGLKACKDLKQGEEVIVVPKEAMITEETARKSYLGE